MAQNDDSDGLSGRVPRQKLEAAMHEVADYRQDLIQNQQLNNEHDLNLLRGFHAAVMRYYLELEVYSDEPAVSDYWESAKLWRGPEGEPVVGIDHIQEWMNNYQTVQIQRAGRGRGTKEKRVRRPMPPDKALRAAQVLDKAAKKIGLTVPVKDVTERPYDDWRTEFEDGVYHGPDDVDNPARAEMID